MESISNLIPNVLLPLPQSKFSTTMSIINFVVFANAGISEFKGKNMQYSKMISNNKEVEKSGKFKVIGSKIGMLVIYTPAAIFGLASFLIFQDHGLRFLLVRLALTIHFVKRVLEVLFLHKYGSSGVTLDAAITISSSYFITTSTMIYTQHLSDGFPEPPIDLTNVGIVLFLLGIGGNLYHHYVLSTLRDRNGDKKAYKIPTGGLFDLVVCPHYLFEVLTFVGVSCISQTLFALSYNVGVVMYLMGRSYATRKWYLSKFEDFPKNVKAMIPFIF